MVSKMQLTILMLQILSVASAGLRQENPNRDLEQGAILTVPSKVAFGKNVKVTFNNPNPNEDGAYAYIAIFYDTPNGLPLNKIPDWDLYFMAWLNDCNTQLDCDSTVAQGSVTFSAKDPKSYYYSPYEYYGWGYFPFRQGKYLVCYINDVYEDDVNYESELITNCKRLQVKNPKGKIKKKAKVIPTKTTIAVGDGFKAKFKTPVPVVNQWIGVFPEENGGPPKSDLTGKSILWGYTGCPTQLGDQKETTNCIKKKKKGSVTLNKKNKAEDDCDNAVWPVPPGRYYMCVNFHAEEPYDFFKCSKKAITVA